MDSPIVFENITRVQPWLIPFPEPESVFADPVERYARLLSPLISIDLSVVNPAWHDWAHMVSPIEPVEGYLGDGTEDYHSYYARSNWLGFRLDGQNRYHLLGDWRFFHAENEAAGMSDDPDLIALYQKEHESYDQTKAIYTQYGRLHPGDTERSMAFLDQVGGTVDGGNWASSDLFPLDIGKGYNKGAIFPLAENGDRFRFVAAVPGYRYRESGAGWILMFYEPTSRIVLFTFDWS